MMELILSILTFALGLLAVLLLVYFLIAIDCFRGNVEMTLKYLDNFAQQPGENTIKETDLILKLRSLLLPRKINEQHP